MNTLEAFTHGDGAHCGLSDWYPEKEAALKAAVDAHQPFDTGWYASKKEIASARISSDGNTILIEVFVSDDFDTSGDASREIREWSLKAIEKAISAAWDEAETDRKGNAPYVGFRVERNGVWEETYLVGWDETLQPPGDNYHWWGWQYDSTGFDALGGEIGIPHPDIPLPAVAAFENWANNWNSETNEKSLRIGRWEIHPWSE